jgi:hypothetical protein
MLPVANPKVLFRALSEGAVLFSTTDEVYFGLNAVGARVWQLLPPATDTLDELCARLAPEYPEVDSQVIRGDVEELLAELTAHGLVLPRDEGATESDGDRNATSEAGEAESARVA